MLLQKKLSALKKGFEAQAPKDAIEIMHRATDDIKNSGILERTVKVGDKAPDFILKNAAEQNFHLQELISDGPVVLSFYRGKW